MQGIVWGLVPVVAAGIVRECFQEGWNRVGVSTLPGQYQGMSVRYVVTVMRAWRVDRGGGRRGARGPGAGGQGQDGPEEDAHG